MKIEPKSLALATALTVIVSGCYTTVRGPDGGRVSVGAGRYGTGVAVNPPGPAYVGVGIPAARPAPGVVVALPPAAPRVVYRGRPAYYYNGYYYRRSGRGYVVVY